jgi:hypothetical protein
MASNTARSEWASVQIDEVAGERPSTTRRDRPGAGDVDAKRHMISRSES